MTAQNQFQYRRVIAFVASQIEERYKAARRKQFEANLAQWRKAQDELRTPHSALRT